MPNESYAGKTDSPRETLEEFYCVQPRDEKVVGYEIISENGGLTKKLAWVVPASHDDSAVESCVGKVVFAPDGSAIAWTVTASQVVIVPWHSGDGKVDCSQERCPLVINTGSDSGLITGPCVNAMTAVTSLSLIRVSNCPGILAHVSDKDVDGNKGQYLLWTSLLGRLLAADLILVTGHINGVIRIWNAYTGRLLVKLLDNKSRVTSLNFAPNGSLKLASGHADHTIKLWDLLDDGNMYKTLKGHTGAVSCVAWSPNGRRLASVGAGRQICIWDLEHVGHGDPACVKISGHKNDIVSCRFTQDGALLATASFDTSVILWDSRSGDKVGCLYHVLPAPHMIYASGLNSCWIRDLALFPDGCHAATVSDDKKLRIWDLYQGNKPVAEEVLPFAAGCCAVSPKGNTVVLGFGNGEVKFFRPRCLVVPSLCHLARLVLRKSVVRFPSEIDELPLPRTLKPYLLYHDLYTIA